LALAKVAAGSTWRLVQRPANQGSSLRFPGDSHSVFAALSLEARHGDREVGEEVGRSHGAL